MTDHMVTVRMPKTDEMPQVRTLWRANSRTLGFLPEGAFEDALRAKHLIVAVNAEEALIGYILYRVSRSRCTIVHMCISPQGRRKGVAKLLNDRLREETKAQGLLGIGLYCRRDYDLSGFWSRLGYIPFLEKEGRSISGSDLTYWWLDHHQPDLFSTPTGTDSFAERTLVVIDANVFIRMHQEDGGEVMLSAKALAADWLHDQVEICVTEELFVEIDRSESKERRTQSRTWALQHRCLSPARPEIEAAEAALRKHIRIEDLVLESDISDFNHLSRALAAGAPYFVTLDVAFLARTADLPVDIGIEVMDPATFVLRLDELRRKTEYAPTRVSGSQIQTRLVRDCDREDLEVTFQAARDGESRPQMSAKLRTYLSAPDRYKTRCIICPQSGYVGLIVSTSMPDGELNVPMLRFSRTGIGPTVARKILSDLVSGDDYIQRINVTDLHVGAHAHNALVESGFIKAKDGSWSRIKMSGFRSADEIYLCVNDPSITIPCNFGVQAPAMSVDVAFRTEAAIWPGKLSNSPLPTFVVSIHPSYAMSLFDSGLAGADLLGASTGLAMACEKVYYRANQKCGLIAPARILWYVKQKKDQDGTMCVRACSLLDEVLVDTPKNLYRQFKRLGVYQWRDVAALVKDPSRDLIMAFRFSHTELFKYPISLGTIKGLGVKAPLQSPARVSSSLYETIYKMGMNYV